MMMSHDDDDVGKYLQVDDKRRFFELNFFLFTAKPKSRNRKQIHSDLVSTTPTSDLSPIAAHLSTLQHSIATLPD